MGENFGIFSIFGHRPMLRSSATGSIHDQMSPSNSATRFNSTTQTSEPNPDQSCAESLLRGADESRADIRQGEFLSQVSLSPASATLSDAMCLESGFSVMRKARCIVRLNLETNLLSHEECLALSNKLEALKRVDSVKDAYGLLKHAKRRCPKNTDPRADGEARTLIFTLEEIKELTKHQLALQANHRALWELSDVVDATQRRLEAASHAVSGAKPIGLSSETPAHQLRERFTVMVDGSVEEIPNFYSGLQFWCEFFEAREGIASLSVMLCGDLEDVEPLTELDVVQRGIKAQEEEREWRIGRSRERMGYSTKWL